VFGPRVLLLDEPLGALDRRLRQQLGSELRRIQQETDTTAIYVTHDQEEAFLLSDTVVVMNDGEICQQGSPLEVYSEPADLFSATFLGDTNVLAGHAVAGTGAGAAIDVRGVVVSCRGGAGAALGEPLQCSVRPEDIQVFPPGQAGGENLCIFGEAIVEQCIFLGSRFRLSLKVRDHRLLAEIPRGSRAPEAGESLAVGWAATAPVVIAESRKAAAGV
jgi:ABC-type Fe3+/spermidine/putrescine transport system ATPase subunit